MTETRAAALCVRHGETKKVVKILEKLLEKDRLGALAARVVVPVPQGPAKNRRRQVMKAERAVKLAVRFHEHKRHNNICIYDK